MLRNVAKATTSVAKYAGKKSIWAGAFAFAIWTCIEMYDGASDRLQTRYTQAKDNVVPPLDATYAKVADLCDKLWTSIEHNPGPSLLAIAVFAATIVYHKVSGRTLKQAIASTVLRSAEPLRDPRPNILIKAEQEVLLKHLKDKRAELEKQVVNLPDQISEVVRDLETLEREAARANEIAALKTARAKATRNKHNDLVILYTTCKNDLEALKDELGEA